MPCTRRIKFEERCHSERRKVLDKQGINWSDVPRDIVECIIRYLNWSDRIRIRAVCKGWSNPNLHIPTIDRIPWAMKEFHCVLTENFDWGCVSGLIDPFSRQYHIKVGKECQIFRKAKPYASAYGWVLFEVSFRQFYLYSPFTSEAIKLPALEYYEADEVVTFSLNATSPKSVVFLLHLDYYKGKVCVKLCSPGDDSWKTFEFNNGFDWTNRAAEAAYVDGVFYCLFKQGQLGAFNVELEEWTILAAQLPPNHSSFHYAKLVVSDSDLLLWDRSNLEVWELFKFDFSEMRWVYQNDLNNYVLFVGCTSFAVPAVGEISQLANTIFYCGMWRYPFVTYYGHTSASGKCVEAASRAMAWIQLPLGGIWRAKDLINAV